MNDKEYKVIQTGMLSVNTILLKLGDVLYIIDPGGDAEKIIRAASNAGCKETVILLTHAHFDHIGAIPELVERLQVKNVYLHPADVELYDHPANCYLPFIPHPENLPETVWGLQDPQIEVRCTPGHTPGGVVYYVPAIKTVFSGDTLFCESIGRTDFPGGDLKTLLNSIRKELFTLPDDTIIVAGHEGESSIGHEKKYNPFLTGLAGS